MIACWGWRWNYCQLLNNGRVIYWIKNIAWQLKQLVDVAILISALHPGKLSRKPDEYSVSLQYLRHEID